MGSGRTRAIAVVTDVVSLLLVVTGILDELDIEYVIGGSLASSQHGEVRATNDIDILVRLQDDDVPILVAALRLVTRVAARFLAAQPPVDRSHGDLRALPW